ncbi:hypothetical protein IKS57_05825, partial [bacterium]|nr:hypothetical protein [bacterium]
MKIKNNRIDIDEKKFENYLEEKKIKLKSKKYIRIDRGTTFLLNDEFYKQKKLNVDFKNQTLNNIEISSDNIYFNNKYNRFYSKGTVN